MAAKKKTPYKLTLQLGEDKLFFSEGATLFEALTKLPKPVKIMNKALLTITYADKQHIQQFWPQRLKRLFYNKHFLEIQAKQLMLGLL